MNLAVFIPGTIIPPSTTDGGSYGSGDGWALVFFAIGCVVALFATVIVYRLMRDSEGEEDSEDRAFNWFIAIMSGLLAGIGWPLTFLGVGVWLLARRIVAWLDMNTKVNR